jgi:hypothetical protein
MNEGTLVILSNPSFQYETWRNECAEVFRLGPDYIDIRLIGLKDPGMILRIDPKRVEKAS